MQDLIASAYTYLEFKGDFENYVNDSYNVQDCLSDRQYQDNWTKVCQDYKIVSSYMSDKSLKECFSLVINEF